MRDPHTPTNLRLRVASLVARYVHPRHTADGPPKIVVDDPTGFTVDPVLAMELRDAERSYHFVYITRISQPEHYKREAAGLEARINEIEQSLECPCPFEIRQKGAQAGSRTTSGAVESPSFGSEIEHA